MNARLPLEYLNTEDEQDHSSLNTRDQLSALELAEKFKDCYAEKYFTFNNEANDFFHLLDQTDFLSQEQLNAQGENILHIIAKSKTLDILAAELINHIGRRAFEQLITRPDTKGQTPLITCCLQGNVELLKFFAGHLTSECLESAAQSTTKSFNVFHAIASSHRKDTAYIVKGIFQGTRKQADTALSRHCLLLLNIDKTLIEMLDIAVGIYGKQHSATLAAQPDEYGNNLVMLSCYTGNYPLILKSVDIMLNGNIEPENILAPTKITKTTPLNVVCALGDLASIMLIINLCEFQRYAHILSQNEYFDRRNILDWCLFAEAKTVGEKTILFDSMNFICKKLDDKLEIALTRQSPLGSLTCRIASTTANQQETNKLIPLKKMRNKLAIAFDIFSSSTKEYNDISASIASDSSLISPRIIRKPYQESTEKLKLALLNQLAITSEPILDWINYAIGQIKGIQNEVDDNEFCLHDQFLISFKDHIESTTSDSLDLCLGFIYLALVYDLDRKHRSEEKNLEKFCQENELALAKALNHYYLIMDQTKKNGGLEFLCRTYDSNSLLKKILSILFRLSGVSQPAARLAACSPLNKIHPKTQFVNNFSKMVERLVFTSHAGEDNNCHNRALL